LELATLREPREVDTLFFGGGTPTYLPPAALRSLLKLVTEWFPLADGSEFSVEANPDGLCNDRIAALAEFGVNRVSLGAQSFDAEHLRILERDHAPDDIADVVSRLQPLIPNIGLDLIFAVPGQTLDQWGKTITAALALSPTHVSTYGLTIEKGTSFWTRQQHGTLHTLPDELERAMYLTAIDRLPDFDFAHYEISNFSRTGYACRHNLVYWSREPYFGFGPGAASLLDGERITRHRSVTHWIRRTLAGEVSIGDRERLTPKQEAREAMMLGLRLRQGIDLSVFKSRYGESPRELSPDAYETHTSTGLLEVADDRLRLTREGCCVADSVVGDFLVP